MVSDDLIRFTSPRSRKRYPQILRLVTIETETGKRLQFLTNHMTLAASTIAEIYKDRWQIEVFFKLLKQNLKIKSFIGGSPNAVWTQIWTAMIAMLLNIHSSPSYVLLFGQLCLPGGAISLHLDFLCKAEQGPSPGRIAPIGPWGNWQDQASSASLPG